MRYEHTILRVDVAHVRSFLRSLTAQMREWGSITIESFERKDIETFIGSTELLKATVIKVRGDSRSDVHGDFRGTVTVELFSFQELAQTVHQIKAFLEAEKGCHALDEPRFSFKNDRELGDE
jgi:hypothetical protein